MKTGFREIATDREFACRSAKYLANQGYGQRQIRSALVEQLDMTPAGVDEVLSILAA